MAKKEIRLSAAVALFLCGCSSGSGVPQHKTATQDPAPLSDSRAPLNADSPPTDEQARPPSSDTLGPVAQCSDACSAVAAAGCEVDANCAADCIESLEDTACAQEILGFVTCLAGQMTMNCLEDLELESIEDFPYCTPELLVVAQCFEREGTSWQAAVDNDDGREDGGNPCSIDQGCQCSSQCASCICMAGEASCAEVCAASG